MAESDTKHTKKTPWKTSRFATYLPAIILGVAALIAIGFGVYKHLQKTVPITSIMTAIETSVNNKYSNLKVYNSGWPAQMGSQQALHQAGYNFDVSSQSMPSIYIGMEDDSGTSTKPKASNPTDAQGLIAAEMKVVGYKIDPLNDTLPAINFTHNSDNCFELYDSTQGILTFSCYVPRDIGQASEQAVPFVTAYNKANPKQPISQSVVIGPIDIKSQSGGGVINPSKSAGYDIAEAVVTFGTTKMLVLFYNKDNGPWQYITQAGDEYGFSCQAYTANPSVRAAMYNQICLGPTGQVRLDSPARATQ